MIIKKSTIIYIFICKLSQKLLTEQHGIRCPKIRPKCRFWDFCGVLPTSEKAKIYNRSKKPDKNLFKIIKFLINYPQNLETIGKMTYNRGMFGGRRRLKMRAD